MVLRPMTIRWELADTTKPQLAMFPEAEREVGKGEYRGLEFLKVRAKRLINEIGSPGPLPFRFTINAYRGCSHACTYCFARPTHTYLDLDAGRDFDTKIVVKINAVELARAETAPGRWSGELIAMGTNTDPYQPAEGKFRLTRGIVEVLAERSIPFSILTKSPLVLRDIELLQEASAVADVRVDFSIATLDEAVWKGSEPGTPHPRRRMEAVARLNAAGITSGVAMGAVLPGLSDAPEQLEEVVAAAVAAGAEFIAPIMLHLRTGVREQYLTWLAGFRPDSVPQYESLYGDRAYAPAAAQRRLSQTVRALVRKHGGRPAPRTPKPPRRPNARRAEQLGLGV